MVHNDLGQYTGCLLFHNSHQQDGPLGPPGTGTGPKNRVEDVEARAQLSVWPWMGLGQAGWAGVRSGLHLPTRSQHDVQC